MANNKDFYQFQQGKRFAVEMIETLRNLANDPKFVLPVVDKLDKACANKPPHFARGIHSITEAVRAFFAGKPEQEIFK